MKRICHKIRQAYGYTDSQIFDSILEYGGEWATEAYEMIMEDENTQWQLLMAVVPLARTPMDKKFGKSLEKYGKSLRKDIANVLAPWLQQRRIAAIKARLARPPESRVYDEDGTEIDISKDESWLLVQKG